MFARMYGLDSSRCHACCCQHWHCL